MLPETVVSDQFLPGTNIILGQVQRRTQNIFRFGDFLARLRSLASHYSESFDALMQKCFPWLEREDRM